MIPIGMHRSLVPSGRDGAAAASATAELERELAAAQRDCSRLAAENERLMELSNALRAQRDRAARAACKMPAAPEPGMLSVGHQPVD